MLLLVLIIISYSILQSIFGVGVLVFGTPTLILLGYGFEEALSLLLPCSIAINSLQLLTDWKQATLKRQFSAALIPSVCLGFALTLYFSQIFRPKLAVGLLLVITAIIRISPTLLKKIKVLFNKSLAIFLPIVGLVHGLTNMGGGLLVIFVSGLYEDKQKIRANVAFGYLIMAISQCLVLIFVAHSRFDGRSAVLAIFAALTYLFLGNKVFWFVSVQKYQNILTAFILIFGIVLLMQF